MAYNIINGFTGLPHVGAGHLATLAKALLGDAHVLDWGDRFACTISTDGRTATIGTGALNMGEGWLPFSDEPVKLAIDAGTAGQKRNDLIVARVRKDGGDLNLGGVQSFELAVVKGANTTGTPADPKDTTANTDSYPLWRIPLDGVTVGTPVAVYKTLATLATVGDSLTATRITFTGAGPVGRIPDRDSIVRVTGMATLSSGTLTPIPFVHPLYPNRSVSFSIDTDGNISVISGTDVTIRSGFLDVFTH